MLRKMRQKGAFFVEYALILSFVTVVGVSFLYTDKSTAANVKEIMTDAGDLLAKAAGVETEKNPEQKPDEGTAPGGNKEESSIPAQITFNDKTFEKGMMLFFEENNSAGDGYIPEGENKVDNTPNGLSISVGKDPNEKNVSGMSELVALEASASYKANLDLSNVKDMKKSDLEGSTLTISNFYKDAKGNYQYNLADANDGNSFEKTFTYKNGSYEGLDSYVLQTNSNKEQYTYISVAYPDGDKNDNINKVTHIIKENLTLNKQ